MLEEFAMKTDIEIAQSIELKPIVDVGAEIGRASCRERV